MHELSVTEGILKICKNEAKIYNFKKVLKINIKVGELSGLIPECISFYFDEISKNTVADGAVLNVIRIPLNYECRDCGYTGEFSKSEYICHKCKSYNVKFLNGRELYIDTMEVE